MLSKTSRSLTYLNAILYAILGALLLLLPEKLAQVFAWKVTAFMTIGGWYLSKAWLFWFVPRRCQWSMVFLSNFRKYGLGI